MAKKQTRSKEPRFEEAIEQLETILERIESGEVGLEDCLKEYETGMKLVNHCRTILDRAEKRIIELTPDENGQLTDGESGSG